MRYALIGCGRVAPNHITAAKANGLEIKAVCDLDYDKAVEFCKDNGLDSTTEIYTDFQKMLDEIKPELTAIATWSGEHARIALEVIRHHSNVIIEKPIALSIEDADKIIEAGKKEDVVVAANHQNRFNPAIREMQSALEEGRLGKLLYATAHVRWWRGKEYYDQDTRWRGTWEEDGGALMNQCIHNGDLLRWMCGDSIEEVFAYTANLDHPYIPVEDMGMAVIKFTNGTYGIFEGTTDARPNGLEETLYLFGSKGTVKAGGMSVNHIDVWNVEGEEGRLQELRKKCDEDPLNVYGSGHTPLYTDVIDAIKSGRKPLVDGEAGKRALELILAIYQSAREGRPVHLPLEKGSTLDNIQ